MTCFLSVNRVRVSLSILFASYIVVPGQASGCRFRDDAEQCDQPADVRLPERPLQRIANAYIYVLYVYMYIYTHIYYIHMRIYVYVDIYIYIYIYICKYVYIYIRILCSFSKVCLQVLRFIL